MCMRIAWTPTLTMERDFRQDSSANVGHRAELPLELRRRRSRRRGTSAMPQAPPLTMERNAACHRNSQDESRKALRSSNSLSTSMQRCHPKFLVIGALCFTRRSLAFVPVLILARIPIRCHRETRRPYAQHRHPRHLAQYHSHRRQHSMARN